MKKFGPITLASFFVHQTMNFSFLSTLPARFQYALRIVNCFIGVREEHIEEKVEK